jgi:hypothetical protein
VTNVPWASVLVLTHGLVGNTWFVKHVLIQTVLNVQRATDSVTNVRKPLKETKKKESVLITVTQAVSNSSASQITIVIYVETDSDLKTKAMEERIVKPVNQKVVHSVDKTVQFVVDVFQDTII